MPIFTKYFLKSQRLFSRNELAILTNNTYTAISYYEKQDLIKPKSKKPYGYSFNQIIYLNLLLLLKNELKLKNVAFKVQISHLLPEKKDSYFSSEFIYQDSDFLQDYPYSKNTYVFLELNADNTWVGAIGDLLGKEIEQAKEQFFCFKNVAEDDYFVERTKKMIIVKIEKIIETVHNLAFKNQIDIDERFPN